ncbi:hypothetical protein BJV74DRAFT_826203 [Russula compacta]|nr:hypothetical protein BJV74DRAFT_826203 [Russula compacta]
MSENIARVYTNTSRRASHKQSDEHRFVYRSVLGNPFHVDWPIISPGLQQSILVRLTALFDGVAAHYELVGNTRMTTRTRAAGSSSHESNQGLATSAPAIIPHIVVGINEVTKILETELRSSRQSVIKPDTTVEETLFLTSVIFICYADLDTPALVAHLPQLVALCNSPRSENQKIKVVQLPAGAQTSLANSLGYLKRVSVMALDYLAPGLDQLEPFLTTVPGPPASWMMSMQGVALEPSHIKQLLTTAPKDMKAAKERRAKGRAAAKRKKTRSKLPHGT